MALRIGGELASSYADGVTFVDLAPVTDPGQVAETVAVAVAAGAGDGNISAQTAVVAALQARHALLILDNAEHLTAEIRQLLDGLLPLCPRVTALVTSRESLGLPGEIVFRLSPMETPPETGLPADPMRYDAVRLFVDRARALMPGFALDRTNAAPIAEICRRLDGIALAIEMAVPRLEVLTPQQLAARLHDRFRALAPLRHDVLSRQRTLQTMFDWSWELLSPEERRLLQLVAVFAVGTTLGSLEAFAAGDGQLAAAGVVEQLTTLAQKSLIVVVAPGPGSDSSPRYRLLETTRQYALDRLDAAGKESLTRQHAEHLAATFERAEAEWPTTHGAVWLDRYASEADNLRAAMHWAFGVPTETELALRLVAAGFSLWWELPGLPLRESRHWYALALARIGPSTPPAIEARLWLGQSWSDTLDGDMHNYPAADRAVRLFQAAGDPIGLGAALWRAASTVLARDHEPSDDALLSAAIQALEGQSATKWLALCYVRRADVLQHRGALLLALAEYDRALTMMQDAGYKYGLMVCGGNRSYLLFRLGRYEAAITALRSLRRELPFGLSQPMVSLLGIVLTAAGRDDEARPAVRESLVGTLSLGMLSTLARSIEAQALLSVRGGDIETAARLLGFVLTVHPQDRVRFGPRLVVFDQLRSLLEAALTPETRQRLLAEGASWTDMQAAEAAVDASDRPELTNQSVAG